MIFRPAKIECDGNPLRVYNLRCNVKAISWNLALVNLTADLIKPIRNPIVHLQVLKKDYANQYKPFLIDVTFNICQVIERRNFLPYGVIMFKLLKRYSNINHTCPYSGRLFMQNGYLDHDLLPPFPQGFYLFSCEFFDTNSTTKDYLGTAKFYVEVMEMVKSKKRPKA
ncbi:uncharacterized protein [Drosophila kikkawai]|uniref:Uncharacterized protein n=1 Tax=Drosophila kikkawai TaxID=30033 RepID=A0A6P4IVP8_DROKI|nr:uncharacterized protein LOC108077913 [Drosophila kikkawai]